MAMETIEIIKTTERRRGDCADLYSQTWGNGLECGTTYPGQYGYSAKLKWNPTGVFVKQIFGKAAQP